MIDDKSYNSDLKSNAIVNMTFQFSLEVVTYVEILEGIKKFVVAKQLIRSGTSIGANVREAQDPESPADFIHKMKIAAKEALETEYWLEICQKSENYPNCDSLINQIKSIRKVLTKIISTSKKNLAQ